MENKKSLLCLVTAVVLLAITSIGLLVTLLNTQTATVPESSDLTSDNKVLPEPAISKDYSGNENVKSDEEDTSDTVPSTLPPVDLPQEVPKEALQPWEANIRLPRSVVPIHYDLYLHPDMEAGLFQGSVEILVDSREPRDHFVLHSKYLEIEEPDVIRWIGSHSQHGYLESSFLHEKNEFLILKTNETMPPGRYTLAMKFRGNLTRGIVGFYKSTYTTSRGEKVPIATSKFQPTYARRAFPCMDEPSFKSTYSVTLVRPTQRYRALSNMPVESEVNNSPSAGLTEVKFQKSVPMVTYLTCFIVCDFEYEERKTVGMEIPIRVYATENQMDRTRYALDIGTKITDFLENYYQVNYPLPKQDMIAIPDFPSGAMEHWGLITYRESSLLYDNRESSSANKQRVALIISHELAHQWFGNLVTLSWWDDLWLNEGFASFVEIKGVADYHPDWDVESQFLIGDMHPVMDLDATMNSHPIIQTVEHPDQITEIFDSIAYSKGASVLRMLENFMGEDEFKLGIKRFLDKFKYGNAVTNDLWSELEAVSSKGLNITSIMDTWTRQMGYPIITVERVKPDLVRLRQSRYLVNPDLESSSPPSPFDYKWEVPISYISSSSPNTVSKTWLRMHDPHIELTFPSGTEWVKFNVGQYGFYRVNYPLEEWENLAQLLVNDHTIFSTTDRSNLINDAFSLAESGHIPYSVPLSMTLYLKKEKDFVPWATAVEKIKFIEDILKQTSEYSKFRKHIVNIVRDNYIRLGWRDDMSHTDRLNRIDIVTLACQNGHVECMAEAGDLFLAWIKDTSAYIPPNLRNVVYKYGMFSKGDETSWWTMFERFILEQNPQEKKKLMFGLAWNNQPWILERYIQLAKNESIVRGQDFFTCLIYISQNPIGLPIVWRVIREEWPYLVNRFSLNDRYLGRLPKEVTKEFSSQFLLNEMKEFFDKYPQAGAGARARKQALENVSNNIMWLNKHQNIVKEWLDANVEP